MRKTIARRVLALLLLASTALLAQQKPATTTKKKGAAKGAASQPIPPPMEAKAIDILKATGARLASAQTLSFTAVEIFEHPSRQGDPLAYSTKYEVKLQRPDKLRVIIAGDGPASEFYDNGKTMMAYAPAENLLAVADAPATVDATLEAAYTQAGIYFPFDDVIVADPYKDIQAGLQMAYYIGQSHVVGGTATDMIAYVDGGVFLQMWVGVDDKLPRMIHAMYLDDPLRLRHQLTFTDWQLGSSLPAETFETAAAGTAKRIQFAHPNQQPQPQAAAKPKSGAAH